MVSKHQSRACDGEGARLAGGRWNSPGLAMIYTAQSAALTALEMLVHLESRSLLSSYILIPCSFQKRLVLRLDRTRLPVRWRAHPAVPQLQLLGDAWLKSGLSSVLDPPSS